MSQPIYVVGPQHQRFVQMLIKLGHPLAAVRRCNRLCLGFQCKSAAQAVRSTAEITHHLIEVEPELLLGLDLGTWMARRAGNRLILFWTGIEVEERAVH